MTSIWAGIRGHQDLREAFARAIDRGRLTQAYAFVGPEGVGKQKFARNLAQSLLCNQRPAGYLEACGVCSHCRPFLAGTHPDFLVVERDPGKRELTVAKFVGEREQRGKAGLCYEFSVRPVAGSRKIAIINDADTMNDEAANALLKTLEEPPPGALLMLIISNPQSVLPTIHSRCQRVRFRPLPEADVIDYVLAEQLANSAEEAQMLAALASGSPGMAQRLSQPGHRDLRETWLRQLSSTRGDGMGLAKTLAEAIEKQAADTHEQRELLTWLLQSAVEFYRTAIRRLVVPQANQTANDAAAQLVTRLAGDREQGLDRLGDLMARCVLAVQQLEQNVSLSLCLEALCSDLSRDMAAK